MGSDGTHAGGNRHGACCLKVLEYWVSCWLGCGKGGMLGCLWFRVVGGTFNTVMLGYLWLLGIIGFFEHAGAGITCEMKLFGRFLWHEGVRCFVLRFYKYLLWCIGLLVLWGFGRGLVVRVLGVHVVQRCRISASDMRVLLALSLFSYNSIDITYIMIKNVPFIIIVTTSSSSSSCSNDNSTVELIYHTELHICN